MRVVSKYMENLGRDHEATIKWILHYLKGTIDTAICCGYQNINLVGFVDANFVGDHVKRRSTTKYAFNLANGVVSWMSKL